MSTKVAYGTVYHGTLIIDWDNMSFKAYRSVSVSRPGGGEWEKRGELIHTTHYPFRSGDVDKEALDQFCCEAEACQRERVMARRRETR